MGDTSILHHEFPHLFENERLHLFHFVLLLCLVIYAHVCIRLKNFCMEVYFLINNPYSGLTLNSRRAAFGK